MPLFAASSLTHFLITTVGTQHYIFWLHTQHYYSTARFWQMVMSGPPKIRKCLLHETRWCLCRSTTLLFNCTEGCPSWGSGLFEDWKTSQYLQRLFAWMASLICPSSLLNLLWLVGTSVPLPIHAVACRLHHCTVCTSHCTFLCAVSKFCSASSNSVQISVCSVHTTAHTRAAQTSHK